MAVRHLDLWLDSIVGLLCLDFWVHSICWTGCVDGTRRKEFQLIRRGKSWRAIMTNALRGYGNIKDAQSQLSFLFWKKKTESSALKQIPIPCWLPGMLLLMLGTHANHGNHKSESPSRFTVHQKYVQFMLNYLQFVRQPSYCEPCPPHQILLVFLVVSFWGSGHEWLVLDFERKHMKCGILDPEKAGN